MTDPTNRLRQVELMKALLAEEILVECMGTQGIWADPSRYRGQCWTRDLVLAVLPVAYESRRKRLLALRHLENLARRQRDDGRVPIVFLDGPEGHARFLLDKLRKSARDRRPSFMLTRYLRGELWNLTPGTRILTFNEHASPPLRLSLDQVRRLEKFCLETYARHRGATVAAVRHGGTIWLFFRWIWRVPDLRRPPLLT